MLLTNCFKLAAELIKCLWLRFTATQLLSLPFSSIIGCCLVNFITVITLFVSFQYMELYLCFIVRMSCHDEWWSRMMHLRYKPVLSRFSSPHHSIALAWARLTVREHTDVVAFERVLEHLQSNVLVDASLSREVRVTCLDHKYVTGTWYELVPGGYAMICAQKYDMTLIRARTSSWRKRENVCRKN